MWRAILGLVIFSLTGCVAVNTTPLGLPMGENRGVIPPDQVAIYRTADQIPGKYREVALLNASGSTTWTSEAGMNSKMRTEAGKMGANAIILDAMSEPGSGAKVAAAVFGVDVKRKGKAIAVYVYPPGTAPRVDIASSAQSGHPSGNGTTRGDASSRSEIAFPPGAAAIIVFKDESTLFAAGITPSGPSDIRITLMDGTNRLVGDRNVTRILAVNGVDQTSRVIEQRATLP